MMQYGFHCAYVESSLHSAFPRNHGFSVGSIGSYLRVSDNNYLLANQKKTTIRKESLSHQNG